MSTIPIPIILQRAGFRWSQAGLEVCVQANGKSMRVLFPVHQIEVIFDRELRAEGASLPPSLGAPGSVGGFFQRVSVGAYSDDHPSLSVGRSRASKARRKTRRQARRKKFFRGVSRGFKAVTKVAKKVVTSPVFRAAFSAVAAAVPVLAPAAAGLEVASRVLKKVDKAKRAAKAILAGRNTAQNRAIVTSGARAKRGIRSMAQLANSGNPAAQRTMGAFAGALANQHARRIARRRAAA